MKDLLQFQPRKLHTLTNFTHSPTNVQTAIITTLLFGPHAAASPIDRCDGNLNSSSGHCVSRSASAQLCQKTWNPGGDKHSSSETCEVNYKLQVGPLSSLSLCRLNSWCLRPVHPFSDVSCHLRLGHPPRRRSCYTPNPICPKVSNSPLQGCLQLEQEGDILCSVLDKAKVERPLLENLVRPSKVRTKQPRSHFFDSLPLQRGTEVTVDRFGKTAD